MGSGGMSKACTSVSGHHRLPFGSGQDVSPPFFRTQCIEGRQLKGWEFRPAFHFHPVFIYQIGELLSLSLSLHQCWSRTTEGTQGNV